MMKLRYLIAALVLIALAGCATQKNLYNYQDYSYKYYKMVKKQDEASKQNFAKSLETIMRIAKNSKKPVPPGVYCEYGLIKASQSDIVEAHKYFNLEKNTWPDSAKLMDYLIQLYK